MSRPANAVTTLEPLTSQRGAKEAAVKRARYDLDNCRVYAPFDARVTNLTISEGAYAHVGQQMFVLIDARRWWAVANFREGQLEHIRPGMRADVYVMSKPDRRFLGFVDSIGFGVTPDADVIGTFREWSSGCPANPQLGSSGFAISGARARRESRTGTVSHQRIRRGHHSRTMMMEAVARA